jgi:rhodanese-related sulfurtransferase
LPNLPKLKLIDKETLKNWLGQPELLLLDIRSPEAFGKSIAKIEGAHRVDPAKIPREAANLPQNRKVVLYCEDGTTKCPAAARELGRRGFQEVYVLEGGWQGWCGKDYHAVPKELTDQGDVL